MIAPCGHTFAQMPQAIQPTLHALVTSLPLHFEEQATNTGAEEGMRSIIPLGQAVMHAPQEIHLSGSI